MTLRIETSDDGVVQTWWLERPAARNAVDLAMWKALIAACEHVNTLPALRVVVIRGVEGNFSAGADIAGLGRQLAADVDGSDYRAANAAAEAALIALPVPTVAVIEGFCIGGGVQIALSCDLRISALDATFGVTPARLGISYPAAALQRLVAMTGLSAATELLLTGDLFDAHYAIRTGLVTSLADDVDTALATTISSLVSRSPFTQYATKQLLSMIVAGRDVATLGKQLEERSLNEPDFAEGLAAFLEKRAPQFGGRPTEM